MTYIKVTDLRGATIRCVNVDGYILPAMEKSATEMKTIFYNVPDIKLRNDDVMLCSFPKTGTNWVFEIAMMILNKSAKRVPSIKLTTMIEVVTENEMDNVPSPRVMNTHLNPRFLPKDMHKKQTKTILVIRNPKDTAVSCYNHMKGMKFYDYNGQWKDWLPLLMGGKCKNQIEYTIFSKKYLCLLEYGSYPRYLKEWEQVISEGAGFPLHVVFYEDLKMNGKHEVERLAEFLDVKLDEQTVTDIVDMCGFDKMSKEKRPPEEIEKKLFAENFNFFRKGQIGDWMNWFTVQQDEEFNKFWKNEMESTQFNFEYTGV